MNPFQNPTIYLGYLRIDEPVTTFTDFILCAVCFYAFLKTRSFASIRAVNLYRWFFLLTGISTLFAAILGHAFLYYFGMQSKIYGWLFGIVSISFAQFAAMNHTREVIGESVFRKLILLNSLELVITLLSVFMIWSFVVVEVHTAYGLLLNVTILEYINYKKTRSLLSINLIYGVGIAVLAVICHVFTLAASVWFNHLDLSHLFMALSMYMMYKGVCQHKIKAATVTE